MVTFEEIDSDEEKITENLKKLNLTIESDLRQVESIQSNREAGKLERKKGTELKIYFNFKLRIFSC